MTRPSKQLRALQPPAGPGWAGRPAQTDRQTDSRCWGTDAGWQEGPAVRALCPPLLPPAPRCLPGAKGGAPVSKPPSACPSSPLGSLAAGTPGEETGPKGSGHRVSDGPESLVVGGEGEAGLCKGRFMKVPILQAGRLRPEGKAAWSGGSLPPQQPLGPSGGGPSPSVPFPEPRPPSGGRPSVEEARVRRASWSHSPSPDVCC